MSKNNPRPSPVATGFLGGLGFVGLLIVLPFFVIFGLIFLGLAFRHPVPMLVLVAVALAIRWRFRKIDQEREDEISILLAEEDQELARDWIRTTHLREPINEEEVDRVRRVHFPASG